MPDIPRLNPAIRALESGKPAFVTFSPAEIGAAQSIGAAAYDGVVFEMEHSPYDIRHVARLHAVHARPRADPEIRQPRAGGGAVRAHPAQRRRDEPVDRQAGARHRRLRHRLAARLDRRGGAQRGAGLPLSAAARGRNITSRPASAATRRAPPRATGASTSRPITSAPTPGRSIPRARCWSSSCARRSARSATCRRC